MKSALIIIGATVLALVSVLVIINAFKSAPPPKGSTGITPSLPAERGRDLGRGEPNDFCATNRLGESFEFNGVTYTCSGPKPYRWRAEK